MTYEVCGIELSIFNPLSVGVTDRQTDGQIDKHHKAAPGHLVLNIKTEFGIQFDESVFELIRININFNFNFNIANWWVANNLDQSQ